MEGSYSHFRQGDVVTIEIRDQTYRVIYKAKFNVRDKHAILNLLKILEKFSGFIITDLIAEKLNADWW